MDQANAIALVIHMLESRIHLCYIFTEMRIVSRAWVYLQRSLHRLPVLERVLVVNSVIIVAGALIGTILTRRLTTIGDLWLTPLLLSLGILLLLLVNYRIIKTSLHPFRDFRNAVDRVKNGKTTLLETPSMQSDPDIHQLVLSVNSMLSRLEVRTKQLQALSERIITAQEEERRRIARSLHDDTSQTVSTLLLQLERLENELPEDRDDLQLRLADARRMVSNMLEDLRKNIWDLRPTILDDLGLIPAIRWYARMRLQEIGIQLNFELGENIRLEPYLETMLFRITQEAVTNILRHAEAETVTIRLKWEGDRVCLEVEDDGRGFDVERTAGEAVTRKQLGLLGIQERVSIVGGLAVVDSSPGHGARLQVSVPLLKRVSANSDSDKNEAQIQGYIP
jgi:two-component system sensor histidine kinase UhpB